MRRSLTTRLAWHTRDGELDEYGCDDLELSSSREGIPLFAAIRDAARYTALHRRLPPPFPAPLRVQEHALDPLGIAHEPQALVEGHHLVIREERDVPLMSLANSVRIICSTSAFPSPCP